jgi:hypothetical protein
MRDDGCLRVRWPSDFPSLGPALHVGNPRMNLWDPSWVSREGFPDSQARDISREHARRREAGLGATGNGTRQTGQSRSCSFPTAIAAALLLSPTVSVYFPILVITGACFVY